MDAKKSKYPVPASTEKIDKNTCILWLPHPIKANGTLFHEITHALQFICEARNIDFILEQEHMGYIAQFVTNEILGWKYE